MKYLLLFVISFAYIETQARECYLSQDQSGTQFVDCRIGAVPPNYKRICPAVNGEKDASLYKVEIADKDGAVLRSWDKDEVLEAAEQVVCTVDPIKVTLKQAQIKAKEDAEKAKKDKETSDWGKACADTKDLVAALICKERGY